MGSVILTQVIHKTEFSCQTTMITCALLDRLNTL